MTAAALSSRSVRLRAVRSGDHDWLYELLTVDAGSRWRYRGRTPNPAEFQQDLWRGVHAQFVVVDSADRPVGLVGSYNVNTAAGHCHLFAVSAHDTRHAVAEATGLLINWLFEEFDFHKLWIEAPEFNLRRFATLTDVADVEGRLTNFDYWRGRYWDVLVLSLNRHRWDERHRQILERRRRPLTGRVLDAVPGVDELDGVLGDLLPLDSLGAIEAISWLEERLDSELDVELLDGLDDLDRADAAIELHRRLQEVAGSDLQQSSGNDGRSIWNGQDPSTVAVTLMS